jgi:hypothetical protein
MNNFAIGAIVVGVIAVVEIVLSLKWNPSYFTFGIPIFIRRIERSKGIEEVPIDELAKSTVTVTGKAFSFRRLAPSVIAFREGEFQYVPLMRGVIRHNASEPYVVVLGLMNWFMLALIVFFAVLLKSNIGVLLLYIGGALAVLYLIQGVRFARMAKKLRDV